MASNIDYLIPALRMELWDLNPASYRYTDAWLSTSLVVAVKSLQRWWSNRYLVDSTDTVISRNTSSTFDLVSPPLVETSDEMPIILMAAYLIKSGELEANSWNVSTWRDAEYYVSNTEGGRMKDISLQRTWDRLLEYLKPPQKRLNAGVRVSFDDFGADETT